MARAGDAGISDIVGTITLLAITVTVVGVAVAGFYSAGQHSQTAPPSIDTKATFDKTASKVVLTHAGGSKLDKSDLRVIALNGTTQYANGPSNQTGAWDIGDPLNVTFSRAVSGNETLTIQVVSQSLGAVVAETVVALHPDLPPAPPTFTVTLTSPSSGTLEGQAGGSFHVELTVDHSGGRKSIAHVWMDLSNINSSPDFALLDDGTNGDAHAGDLVYSADVPIPVGVNASWMPDALLPFGATDSDGFPATVVGSLTLDIHLLPGIAGGGSVGQCSGSGSVCSPTCAAGATCSPACATGATCSPSCATGADCHINCELGATCITSVPGPTITTFSPLTGPPSTLIHIVGTHLNSSTSMSFVNGATSYGASVWWATSETDAYMYPPSSAPTGVSYNIRATGPGGSDTSTDTFALTAGGGGLTPTLVTFNPPHGKAGDTITLSGQNLDTVRRVTLVNATRAFSADAEWYMLGGQVKFIIPVGAAPPGAADYNYTIELSGTFSGVYDVTPELTVDHEPPPAISAFSPDQGVPFTQVNVFGANFVNVQSVTFNGSAVYWTTVTPTQILVVTHQAITPGWYAIIVTTATGCASTKDGPLFSCTTTTPAQPNPLFHALRAPVIPVYPPNVFKSVNVWAQHNVSGTSSDIGNMYVKIQLNDSVNIGGDSGLLLVTNPVNATTGAAANQDGCTGPDAIDTTSVKLCNGYYYNPFKPGNQPPTPFPRLVCANTATRTYVFQYNATLPNYVSTTYTWSFYLEFSFSTTGQPVENLAPTPSKPYNGLHPVSVTTTDANQYFNLAPNDSQLVVDDHGTSTTIQSCT